MRDHAIGSGVAARQPQPVHATRLIERQDKRYGASSMPPSSDGPGDARTRADLRVFAFDFPRVRYLSCQQ